MVNLFQLFMYTLPQCIPENKTYTGILINPLGHECREGPLDVYKVPTLLLQFGLCQAIQGTGEQSVDAMNIPEENLHQIYKWRR
jgi:hypothetical protein